MRNAIVAAVLVCITAVVYMYFGPGAIDRQNPIRIEESFARASGKSAKAGAAFMTIYNRSGQADRLISAKTDAAGMVELHTHMVENDIMQMRKLDSVLVPAGHTIMAKPHSLHLMLIGLKQPLKNGENYPLTLSLSDGTDLELTVAIEQRNGRHAK